MAYLVASTQRSGSTWWCWLLEQVGIAGHPVVEHWNLSIEQAAHVQHHFVTYRDYLAYVRQRAMTPNGMLGLNIMWRQMPGALTRMRSISGWAGLQPLQLWLHAFPDLDRFMFTYRSDVLGQAISWARAHQTRQFTSEDAAEAEPVYDFWLIDTLYHDIMAHNLGWEMWFRQYNIRPLYVRYEDVVTDPLGKLKEALAFLGLTLPPGYQIAQRFVPQRDGLNAYWRKRWLAESRRRHIWVEDYRPA